MASKHILSAAVALSAFAAGSSAQAQVGAAVTLDAGTTGLGVHLVVPMESTLNGRFGVNYFKHDFDKRSGQVDYKLDGKLQTFDALFDWYLIPNSSFRLTGGVLYNGSRFDALGTPAVDGKFTFNGKTYTAADAGTVRGEVRFRRAAPYLGIGWGNALAPNQRWSFQSDLGVYHQGKAQVKLGSWGCTASASICKTLASDLEVEAVRLTKEVSDYKLYPVLRASVSYSF